MRRATTRSHNGRPIRIAVWNNLFLFYAPSAPRARGSRRGHGIDRAATRRHCRPTDSPHSWQQSAALFFCSFSPFFVSLRALTFVGFLIPPRCGHVGHSASGGLHICTPTHTRTRRLQRVVDGEASENTHTHTQKRHKGTYHPACTWFGRLRDRSRLQLSWS